MWARVSEAGPGPRWFHRSSLRRAGGALDTALPGGASQRVSVR